MPLRNIYVASSWKNQHHNSVVRALKAMEHTVYDFKNPPSSAGFGWEQLGEGGYQNWTPEQYINFLYHPRAIEGYNADIKALNECDTCLLLLPCGRSAHLEAGYAKGAGKELIIFVSNEKFEPDLMYKMANLVTDKIEVVYEWMAP